MIDAIQTRAARAMLDWSRADLSSASGVSEEAIRNFERGFVNRPHTETLEALRQAFEKRGIEFTANSGVRLRPEGVEVLSGRMGLISLLDRVYAELVKNGGSIMATGIEEEVWVNCLGDYAEIHENRMKALLISRNDIMIYSLTKQGNLNPRSDKYTEYRWLSKDSFSPVPFYICGDMLAVVSFQIRSEINPKIVLIDSASIASAYRIQFEEMWEKSNPVPETRCQI